MTGQTQHPTTPPPEPQPSFYGMGIAPRILEILDKIHFKVPTPIQSKAIPLATAGQDVIGIAQTGTGKTHAFMIPMVQRLAQAQGIGLVLAPTRELALQIEEAARILAGPFGMNTACLIGGAPMEPQEEALRSNPRIIIATPGRLIDHLSRWNVIPNDVCMLVLDEADRMLDMGFAPQVEKILRHMPRQRQTMLFSATMPPEIMYMVKTYMKLPVHVQIAPSGTTAEHVTQEVYIVKKDAKVKLLGKILAQYKGSVLLFSATKSGASKITRSIRDMKHRCAEIHSDRSLPERRMALDAFKSGRCRILVATDIAARGIDVSAIELVINFDLPEDAENYVHRIGRTGRAGCKGHAISFATPEQSRDVTNIEKLIRQQLPIVKHPDFPPERFSTEPPPRRPGVPSHRHHPKSDKPARRGGHAPFRHR